MHNITEYNHCSIVNLKSIVMLLITIYRKALISPDTGTVQSPYRHHQVPRAIHKHIHYNILSQVQFLTYTKTVHHSHITVKGAKQVILCIFTGRDACFYMHARIYTKQEAANIIVLAGTSSNSGSVTH